MCPLHGQLTCWLTSGPPVNLTRRTPSKLSCRLGARSSGMGTDAADVHAHFTQTIKIRRV